MNQITKADLQMQGRHAPASQATHVEQSRAIAQVQGALIVAMQNPRDEIFARNRMENACQVQALAEHAFFRYSRGGSQITGPSIHLACELARCWGNVDYGITELRRDDAKGESEMLAYAWDLEVNNRVTNSFIVPHKRDKKGGPEALTDMRDIYENNANAAARRLRECIFRVLPKAFLEEAKSIASKTLEEGGGEPIEQRREKLLEAFAGIGVNRKQIERKIGRAADRLTAYDIGVLRVVFKSIKQGEVAIADEFESDAAAEVKAALTTGATTPAPDKPATTAPDPIAIARAKKAAEIEAAYLEAQSVASLLGLAKSYGPDLEAMPDERARLDGLWQRRKDQLEARKPAGDLLDGGTEARG